ncbi:MAG: hypothetical protein EBZ49_00550 [Proteobacteria bacterium]|nr:hypothetical protein [Pseudomonadota bacterium]
MSSCPLDSDKFKREREEEIRVAAKIFLKQVALNLCIPEGVSGKIDLAFGISRQHLVGEVMKELGEELTHGDEQE